MPPQRVTASPEARLSDDEIQARWEQNQGDTLPAEPYVDIGIASQQQAPRRGSGSYGEVRQDVGGELGRLQGGMQRDADLVSEHNAYGQMGRELDTSARNSFTESRDIGQRAQKNISRGNELWERGNEAYGPEWNQRDPARRAQAEAYWRRSDKVLGRGYDLEHQADQAQRRGQMQGEQSSDMYRTQQQRMVESDPATAARRMGQAAKRMPEVQSQLNTYKPGAFTEPAIAPVAGTLLAAGYVPKLFDDEFTKSQQFPNQIEYLAKLNNGPLPVGALNNRAVDMLAKDPETTQLLYSRGMLSNGLMDRIGMRRAEITDAEIEKEAAKAAKEEQKAEQENLDVLGTYGRTRPPSKRESFRLGAVKQSQ
jgi:hypothetical protein